MEGRAVAVSGEAQVMDAGATMEVPSLASPGDTVEVEYRLMVVRRALAGQVGCAGGAISMSPGVRQTVAPGWTVRAEGDIGRSALWAMEHDGQTEDRRLWFWNSEGAAAWVVPDKWSGALPVASGLPWLRVERQQS
jgi:hypothetical protein